MCVASENLEFCYGSTVSVFLNGANETVAVAALWNMDTVLLELISTAVNNVDKLSWLQIVLEEYVKQPEIHK